MFCRRRRQTCCTGEDQRRRIHSAFLHVPTVCCRACWSLIPLSRRVAMEAPSVSTS